MGLAVLEDHLELARVVRFFLEKKQVRADARAALDGGGTIPAVWKDMAAMGWLGLHVPEEYGGSGCGLMELAIVLEELGRQCAPGPFLPTVVLSAAIIAAGKAEQLGEVLTALAGGNVIAGLSLDGSLQLVRGQLFGVAGTVLSASDADLLALVVGDDFLTVDKRAPGVVVEERANLDLTRPSAEVRFGHVQIGPSQVVEGGGDTLRRLFEILSSAEAAGGAAACREMATRYAHERVAFGRPIGQFQAVKHHCANMLVDEQLAVGAVWDVVRNGSLTAIPPLGTKAAAAVSIPAFLRNAKMSIQVHGGVGFTWEHDAHLYLRRATALAAFTGSHDALCVEVARLGAIEGLGHSTLELPPEAEAIADEARQFLDEYQQKPENERHRLVVQRGYLYPQWPPPWGRGAGPLEQLVLDEVFAAIPRYEPLGIPAWTLPIVLPTLMIHGTEDQKERWIRPTMEADLVWCQLFSEPGAGSDLASLATRAERTDGGWVITGQKVWTSSAHLAQRGFALVRTDRDASKHHGITCMVVDMRAKGVTIRPLRQMTGGAEFNEVFLDEVFVPDADVVGQVHRGWEVALTTLGNERVSLGERDITSAGTWKFLQQVVKDIGPEHGSTLVEIGEVTAGAIAARALNLRVATRFATGAEPGVEGNLTKLIFGLHAQRMTELGVRVLGERGVYVDRNAEVVTGEYLRHRSSTIAGGTSEILRNIIGERALDLPRDPMPLASQRPDTQAQKGR